jgi:hypothetical protein
MAVKKHKLPTKAQKAKIRKKVSETRDRLDRVYELSDPAKIDDPKGRKELDLHIKTLAGALCQLLCGCAPHVQVPQICFLSYTPPKKK